MRSPHFIRPVLLVMVSLDAFVLLVAACMKTIPAESVSVSSRLENDAPLRRLAVVQDDYKTHISEFRAAKLFRSSAASSSASVETSSSGETVARLARREEVAKGAKTFTIKSRDSQEDRRPEPEVIPKRDDNDVHDDRDLFAALQVEKSDICATCPGLWMKKSAEMKDLCSNHASVSEFFSMTMDRRDAANVADTSDLKECTRVVTCSEPHMLVKWHESDLCDVHAPSTGSLVTDSTSSFVYKCNGTHWSMHGFPVASVVCAISSN